MEEVEYPHLATPNEMLDTDNSPQILFPSLQCYLYSFVSTYVYLFL